MSTRVLTVFMFFVTFVFSSCGPVSMEDAPTLIIPTEDISALVVPTEEISDQPVPVLGYD